MGLVEPSTERTHRLDVERIASKVPGDPPESWFAVCECGWRGHARYSVSDAISDFGAH